MPNAHTPGPWFYDFAGNTAAVIVDSEGDHVIDLVATSNTTAQSALADNARLIAAAPGLLQALQTVASQLRLYGEVKSGGAIEEIVNEAIAQATGA